MSASISQISFKPRDKSSIIQVPNLEHSKNTNVLGIYGLNVPRMREIIRETLSKKLEMVSYDVDVCQIAVKDLSEVIKSKLKDFNLQRHKIIVQVMIAEQKNQGLQLVNKCFWDQKTDVCVVEQFKNDSLFCVVVVYVICHY